jgi:putative peptidoglycan lipid II flippase
MGPRLLGVAVVQLNFWVNTRLASSMVEGSVIGITLAFALMLMPQAAIAQSIAIAAMPTFSAQVALGKLDEMRSALASSLRGALLLSIPASVGLLLLRVPVITLLYQHGRFTERSTQLVAWALLWYAAGLVGHSLVEILSRAYYSLHDTLTPVLVGAGAMSLNVLFSLVFSHWFELAGWMPHGGLALANSLATALEAGVLVVLMRRKLSGLKGRYILDGALRAAAATLVMGLVLWLWIDKLQQPAWLVGLGGVGLGSLVFGMVALALGIREFQSGVQLVMRRLRVMIG